jgi:hypothetical protein
MADYYEQTVVQQTIPDADMTPLERLLLSHIFQSERDGDGWYFFAEEYPNQMVLAARADLEQALASSPATDSILHRCVSEQLANAAADAIEIDLDFSGTSWIIFQEIVGRSKTLQYITVVTAFTCSRMRPDGFGGMAVLITPDAILGKSTDDILDDFLTQAGLNDAPSSQPQTPGTAPGAPP